VCVGELFGGLCEEGGPLMEFRSPAMPFHRLMFQKL
jgi:hypothetical protein